MMRRFALLGLAGILVACGGPRGDRSGFADFLPADMPLVRGESAPAWDREEYPVVVRPEGDGVRILLGYEAEDGGPRERHLDAGKPVPWPAGLAFEKPRLKEMGFWYRGERPALLLGAAATTPWQSIPLLRDAKSGPYPSLYLAGRREDGSLAAVPLHARVPTEMVSMGPAFCHADLFGPADATREICAIRKGDSLRLWYGPLFRKIRPEPQDLEGEIVATEDELRLDPPHGLDSFARGLRRRSSSGDGQYVVVDIGEEVTYRDVLRIAECGGGDEFIAFEPDLGGRSFPNVRLPLLEDPDDPVLGTWGGSTERRLVCLVDRTGRVTSRGREFGPELLDKYEAISPEPMEILMWIDVEAPWSACRPIVDHAGKYGDLLHFGCRLIDPGIRVRGDVRIPPPGPGAAKIRAPDDRPAGEVLADVMNALRAGATAIAFDE